MEEGTQWHCGVVASHLSFWNQTMPWLCFLKNKVKNAKPSPILKCVFSYYNAQEKQVKDIFGKVAF